MLFHVSIYFLFTFYIPKTLYEKQKIKKHLLAWILWHLKKLKVKYKCFFKFINVKPYINNLMN